MAVNPALIRNTLTVRPRKGGTRAYVLGVADHESVPHAREYMEAAAVRWLDAYLRKHAQGGETPTQLSQLIKKAERAWRAPVMPPGAPEGKPVQRTPSPYHQVLARFRCQLTWWVAADREGQQVLNEGEPFVFPDTCLSRGVFWHKRLYPGDTPNIELGQGKEDRLVPYQGTDPSEVAKWWFYMVAQGWSRVDVTRFRLDDHTFVDGEA